jgi:hypothetical protein
MPTFSSSLLSTGSKLSLLTFKVDCAEALEILAALGSLESEIFA